MFLLDLFCMYILKGLTIDRPVGLLSIPPLSVMLYLCCILVCLLIVLYFYQILEIN